MEDIPGTGGYRLSTPSSCHYRTPSGEIQQGGEEDIEHEYEYEYEYECKNIRISTAADKDDSSGIRVG